jgi:hypothetical protein
MIYIIWHEDRPEEKIRTTGGVGFDWVNWALFELGLKDNQIPYLNVRILEAES